MTARVTRNLRKRLLWTVLCFFSLSALAYAKNPAEISEKAGRLAHLKENFTFVVLGDNRDGDDVYGTLLHHAMAYRPDFLINTGDQVRASRGPGVWERFRAVSAPVTVPYFLTAGNHDVHDTESGRAFRKEAGLKRDGFYYSFTAGNSLFIVLDTHLENTGKVIAGKQYAWLKKILATPGYRHTFVFLHLPLFPEKNIGRHFGACLDEYPGQSDDLQNLFAAYGVRAVFSGHEHLYLRKNVGGVAHIITGGGGAPLYADEQNGGFHHVVLITVDGDNVSGTVIDADGATRERFHL